MIKISLFIMLLLGSINLPAQHFQVPASKVNTVMFANLSGQVRIEGTTKDEISIDYYPEDGQAKLIGGGTGVGLEFLNLNKVCLFTGILPETAKGRYVIQVPEKVLLNYQSEAGYTQQVTIVNCTGDIDVNMPKDVTLDNVSGGIVIKTVAGKVTVKSAAIQKNKPVSIITESGTVHFSFPQDTDAELKLGSTSGTVHARLRSKKGNSRMDGKQFSNTIGAGGTKIRIQSLSGDIHLEQF